jgi:hypothetical protein
MTPDTSGGPAHRGTGDAAGVVAQLDLDARGATPGGRRRPPTLAVLVVVGLLAGGVAHAWLRPVSRTVPVVAATLEVLDYGLAPDPVVDLRLRVTNGSDTSLAVESVQVTGAGLVTRTASVGRRAAPSGTVTRELSVPLRCPGEEGDATSPTATVLLSGPTGTLRLPAVTVDVTGGRPLACPAAAAALPEGWDAPVVVTASQRVGADYVVDLAGLASSAQSLRAVRVDTWLVPALHTTPLDDGALRVRLAAPEPACFDLGSRSVLPAGVQLVMAAQGRLTTRYAAVGPDLSRWLAEAYDTRCSDA